MTTREHARLRRIIKRHASYDPINRCEPDIQVHLGAGSIEGHNLLANGLVNFLLGRHGLPVDHACTTESRVALGANPGTDPDVVSLVYSSVAKALIAVWKLPEVG